VACQFVTVGISNHDQVFDTGINADDLGASFHMCRTADISGHDASERHEPATRLEPHGRLEDPCIAGFDTSSKLSCGLVGPDCAQSGQSDVVSVRSKPNHAGGK
jgi:hypothetical protein